MIKLLIGGSPCTYWSIAQKEHRETEASGMGWELFKNYLIAKQKFQPDFFLYENNKSASQPIKDQIRHELGAEQMDGQLNLFSENTAQYIEINSALVSAQNRQRFYVHNCGDVGQPEDRGIMLKDILECGEPFRGDKAYCLDANYWKGGSYSDLNNQLGRRLQVAEPVRVGTLPTKDGELNDHQHSRIYSIDGGKATTQSSCGGGLGAKTGLYAVPINETENGKSQTIKAQYDKSSVQNFCCYSSTYGATGVAIETDEKPSEQFSGEGKDHSAINKVYEVKDGLITIKGKQYPIKLKDGCYNIRKLTVTECARLQTMPDDYCRTVSNSQAYKGLGNGWTAEVIIHILNGALQHIERERDCGLVHV